MVWILLNHVSSPTFVLRSSHKRIIFLPNDSLDGQNKQRLHTVSVATVRMGFNNRGKVAQNT